MSSAGVEIRAEKPTNSRRFTFFLADSPALTALLAAILLLATLTVYLPVRHSLFFNLDDYVYVVENGHVHHGLDGKTIRWAFTSLDMGNWIPLSFLSHAIDYQLFGDDPAGHHFVNALLHALNAALLFWVLKRATGYTGRSFMVAALFAVHPLNVEAVAWIAERKTVLSMLFFLLALGAYQGYAREPRESRYRVVALLFATGLMAKAQIISLPFVLLLWDYWPLQRMSLGQELSPEAKVAPLPQKSFASLVREKLSLLFIVAAVSLLTIHSEGGVRVLHAPLRQRLANAAFSYTQYLAKAFWPSKLAPMYPDRGGSLSGWQVGGACIFLIAITTLVIAGRRHRYLPVGWFMFLGMLVPMLQIVQFGREGMADRFAYQALIGLLMVACWGLSDWARQRHLATAWLAAGSAVALLVLTMVTYRQIGYWKDPATMWSHALIVKDHWVAEAQVGAQLMREGKTDEAMPHLHRALALKPEEAVSNISIAYYDQTHGNPQDAVARYQAALKDYTLLPPDLANVYKYMGLAYSEIGDSVRARECFDKAAEWRRKAEEWRGQ